MALDTIPTPVSPDVVQKYLKQLDDRGETYGFNVNSTPQAGKPVVMTLYRDGCDDALELHLAANGTWGATHVIVVGEKE